MQHYPEELRNQPLPVVLFMSSDISSAEKVVQLISSKIFPGNKEQQQVFRIINEKWGTAPATPTQRPTISDRKPIGGVLKADWMRKYYHNFASCVVFFLEWPERNERTLEVWKSKTEREVSVVLDALVQNTKWSKGLKITVVLLQTDYHGLPSDSAHDERLAALSKFVDVKAIFYFSMLDMAASTKKLEKIIQKQAYEFYSSEAVQLKKQLDSINRQTQLKLLIRRHFQIGYFHEFAEKKNKSLKHYNFAYNYLIEAKKGRSETDEMKVIADFTNYKICRLYMDLSLMADAINQFYKHVSYYKNCMKENELEFQHCSWVANQYEVFGQLMIMYQVHQYAPAIQSQQPGQQSPQQSPTTTQNLPHSYWHPGFYFQAASFNQIARRKNFEKVFQQYKDDPRLAEIRPRVNLPSWTHLNPEKQPYIGHFTDISAFKDEVSESELANWSSQQIAVAQETLVNHSNITVTLLKQTLDMYGKDSVNERTKLALQVELANELMVANKFQEARWHLDFLSKEFEKEQWWGLLSEVLNQMLTLANTTGSVIEEIKYSLKLLNPEIGLSEEKRKDLQKKIHQLLYNTSVISTAISSPLIPPARVGRKSADGNINSTGTTSTTSITSNSLNPLSNPLLMMGMREPLIYNLSYEHPLLSCKIAFTDDVGYSNQPILGNFRLVSNFPLPITFNQIILTFIDTGDVKSPRVSAVTATSDAPAGTETIHQKSTLEFTKELDTEISSENVTPAGSVEDSKSGITVLPGQAKIIPFQFIREVATFVECSMVDAIIGNTSIPHNPQQVIFRWDLTQWPKIPANSQLRLGKNFIERSSVRVLEYATKLNMELKHHPPLLIHEYYQVDLVLENPMKDVITNATALFTPQDNFIYIIENGKRIPCTKIDIDNIPPLSSVQKTIYLLVQQITDQKTLEIKVKYETEKYSTSISKKLPIPVQPPFQLLVDYYSKNFQVLTAEGSAIKAQEKFLLQVETTGTTPFPIRFVSINLLVSDTVADHFGTSPLINGHELVAPQKFTHWFQFNAKQLGIIKLGYVVVTWMRSGPGADGNVSKTSYILPPVDVYSSDFSLNYEFGSSAMVGEPFPFSVLVSNHSNLAQDFLLRAGDSEHFLFAGEKKSQFTINPGTTYHLDYTMVPLTPGRVSLPKFDVTTLRTNIKLTKQAIEQYVFVRPLLAKQMRYECNS